jgi:hypothetical protein
LLRQIADAACIKQDHVGLFLFDRDDVAALEEHLSHLLRVALVHLATVGLDVNPSHSLGGVQETGVQEFRSSGVQEFRSSGVQDE